MTATVARQVLERTRGHIVTSLFLDLDPGRFATAPARASQIRSLLDEAGRAAQTLSVDHAAAQALRRDLSRLEEELAPDDLPAAGQGLAVYRSGGDDPSLVIPLSAPVAPAVFVEPVAHVEPVVIDPVAGRWCAVLVSVDDAHILEGAAGRVIRRSRSEDYVRGRSQTGDTRTHSREQDIAGHLKQVASELRRRHQAGEFESLMLAGGVEALTGLESALPDELSKIYLGRLSVDPSAGSDSDVAAAVAQLAAKRRTEADAAALAELRDRIGGERVAVGVEAVQEALVERRVETLLMRRDYDDPDNRREAMVQAALSQDADVRVYDEPDELPPPRPVAALLRF
ncbi:MAG TPA: hypothetical protein VKV21_03990 [Solirubrobacteraceae bacterium]|nr:hypothetical protein [Solirubrobacteraceae bacterium]